MNSKQIRYLDYLALSKILKRILSQEYQLHTPGVVWVFHWQISLEERLDLKPKI